MYITISVQKCFLFFGVEVYLSWNMPWLNYVRVHWHINRILREREREKVRDREKEREREKERKRERERERVRERERKQSSNYMYTCKMSWHLLSSSGLWCNESPSKSHVIRLAPNLSQQFETILFRWPVRIVIERQRTFLMWEKYCVQLLRNRIER